MGLWLSSPWETAYAVIPDEQDLLEKAMIEMADQQGCCLIVTTGGTGPALRDVTPEATAAVCEKLLPGFGEQMRQVSLHPANQSLFVNAWRLFFPPFLIASTLLAGLTWRRTKSR